LLFYSRLQLVAGLIGTVKGKRPMTQKSFIVAVVGLVCAALVVGGCETYARSGALGAGLGAATGAAIGSASGDAGQGALIGAAVGGLAGLITHDVRARRAKSREETAAKYDYEPSQGEVLSMENAQVLPSVVRPGGMAEMTMQYALLGAGEEATVTETRQLRRGADVLSESSQTVTRGEGTWVSTQQFELPRDAKSGEYTVYQRASTATSTVSASDTFIVEP
jgi:hypothetical protein